MIPVFHTAHIDFASQHQDAIRELMIANVPRAHRPKEWNCNPQGATTQTERAKIARDEAAPHIKRMLDEGKSLKQIGAAIGRSHHFVGCVMRERGWKSTHVHILKNAEQARKYRQKLSPAVMALHREERSNVSIAETLGVSRALVARIIREAGA